MPVSPALTPTETAALAGVSTVARYLSPVPDVDIATAQINQVSFVYPLAQLTVDNTSADWADVAEGDTVYIGTSAGASDIGIYRVRLTGNSTTIFLGEVSSQDVGQLPIAIRTAGFANNQHISVKRRYDIWSVLPVINSATGAIYEDYNRTVGTNNTTPPPLVSVYINNVRNHLATLIADSAVYALEAIATPTSWTTSTGETFDYLWTVPASGWSSVSGDTTDTLTADVDPGNYILLLEVTGSLSGTTQRVCFVHIHAPTDNPPLLISEMPRSDTRDRVGRRMSFDLYSNHLEDIPNGAACIYFEMATWANQWVDSDGLLDEALDTSETGVDVDDGSLFAIGNIILIDSEQMKITGISTDTLTVTRAYNGTTAAAHTSGAVIYLYAPATNVPTATRQMAGWVQRQDKSTADGLRQATIDLISPSYLLNILNSTSQVVQVVASPTTWQEVVAGLSSASFMAWYMLQWRCANILRLFNFTPFGVDPVGQRLPSWTVDKGTVLQQIQLLATERGNFGCNSEGEFFFLRNPQLVDYADRGSVVVRDSLDASLYVSASNPRELTNRVQQVRGEAFSWDGAAALPTPYYADAPTSPGQGTAQTKLPAQVVIDQDELNQLTGDQYARLNNPYPAVNVKIRKNRDVYEPAEMAFVDVTIPDYLSADGVAYQANIIPLSVSKTHNADGTSDIDLTGEGETHNIPGTYVPVPVGNDSMFSVPYTPIPIDPISLPSLGEIGSVIVPAAVPSPQGATVSPGKGAIWITADGGAVQRTFDITVEPPVVEDITPDTFFTAFVMIVHDKSSNFSRAAYVLGNDGADSKVAYTTDTYADTVVWEYGATLTGIYTNFESAGLSSLAGGVVAYKPSDTTVGATYTDDMTSGLGLKSFELSATYPFGTWTSGGVPSRDGTDGGIWIPTEGRTGGGSIEGMIVSGVITQASVVVDLGAEYTVTGFSFYSKFSDPVSATANWLSWWDASKVMITEENTGGGGSAGGGAYGQGTWTGSVVGARYVAISATGNQAFGPSTAYLDDIVVTYDITGTGSADVSTSDDYGATFATETVGTAPGTVGAFCLSRYGTVALAAEDALLNIATEFGGAFIGATGGSTAGTYPLAARIPWFKIGKSSKTNNGLSPDYYLSSAAAISTESLWKIVSGVKTAITPSVTGTKALGVSSSGIGTYGASRVMFIGDVSGDVYVFRSTNAGATWSHVQIDNAVSVRAQRFSPSGLIWILGAGADGAYYSSNGGTSWSLRTIPDGALFIEIFG
jgi:hypothetical protein